MTERDQSRDRPGDEMIRLTVAEAARRLGISEAGVRKRVQRGQMPYERDDARRVWVWVSPGELRHAESRDEPDQSRDSDLVDELRDRLRYVEGQLEAERQAHAEARRLLMAALERIPPQLEATAQEPSESSTAATPQPGRVGPQPEVEAPQESAARVIWWRRWFRG